jgi:ribonuclease HI
MVDFYVYTDGACSNNGKENANAGIGIYFQDNDPRNVSKRITGKQTNNRAELLAIIVAYFTIEKDIHAGKTIVIGTDSEYAIRCFTTYGEKCAKQCWRKDIPNKELVQQGYELFKDTPTVSLMHIRAHTGATDVHSLGNAKADQLATQCLG